MMVAMERENCRLSYQGDPALAGLLVKAASPYDVAGVRALIRGVNAAASAVDPRAWCVLVAADPSPALQAQLLALKHEIAEADAAAAIAGALAPMQRLDRLRAGMQALAIDAFLVPRSDEYQNEYVPACAERLAWLTGFTGSAGLGIVLMDQAAIFVDGRYTVQVRAQIDPTLWTPRHLIEEPPETWLASQMKPGQVLGYDPWLMTPAQLDRFRGAVDKAGAVCRAVSGNPVDAAWTTRPAPPLAPVLPHPIAFTGQDAREKREKVAIALVQAGCAAQIITAADSLAWLLNIRGSDVQHTPLALGFAILTDDAEVTLFIDHRKITPALVSHLGAGVRLAPPDAFGPALAALSGRRVQLDASSAAAWIFDRLTEAGAEIIRASDPIQLLKACKNPVEAAGIRASHRRDGAAMVRFLHWFETAAADGTLTEIGASDQLERFRAVGEGFRDLSFPTISAAGPNGALPHYRADPATQRVIPRDWLYLVDSGAQYLDGTTDITRTIAVGMPTPEMMDRYTRVLKGHIALARAVFPRGCSGSQLDVLARQPLWQIGLNYDHGTGHGVGSYLGVHEGPQRISSVPNAQALLPGMLISNEPGFYKQGHFGIRIENLVLVVPVDLPGAERPMLGFETVTLCPIDRRPIDRRLLDSDEIAWLDAYHQRVRAALSPLITEPATLLWLEQATAPL